MTSQVILRLVRNVDLVIACAALTVVVGSVTWGVLTRYIFPQPATWTTELSGIAFAWVVFFGAAAALRRGMHIGIPILVDMAQPRIRKLLAILATGLVVAFLGYTFYLAAVLASQSMSRPSPVLRIPFLYVYAGVALAIFFMFVHAAIQFVQTLRSADGTMSHSGPAAGEEP